jgi:hypothetical protein
MVKDLTLETEFVSRNNVPTLATPLCQDLLGECRVTDTSTRPDTDVNSVTFRLYLDFYT